MKKILTLFTTSALLLVLFQGCFRQEIQVAEYHVPAMTTPEIAAHLQQIIKTMPGVEESSYELETRILRVHYQSSTIRKMNIEETIAFAGFAVNNRPANPTATKLKGLN